MTLIENLKEEVKKQQAERNRIFKHYEQATKLKCDEITIRKYEEKFAEATGKIKGLEKAIELVKETIG